MYSTIIQYHISWIAQGRPLPQNRPSRRGYGGAKPTVSILYIYIYIHIYANIHTYYIYIYIYIYVLRDGLVRGSTDARPRARIDICCEKSSDSGFQRVWFKQNLNFKGWNYHVHRGFSQTFELMNLSRENLSSREIGRTLVHSFLYLLRLLARQLTTRTSSPVGIRLRVFAVWMYTWLISNRAHF